MIENMLVLSTAHISQATDKILTEFAPTDFEKDLHDEEDRLPFRFVAHHYGYIFFLNIDSADSDVIEKTQKKTPELVPIIKYAFFHKCTLINMDRDAEEVANLPTYKW